MRPDASARFLVLASLLVTALLATGTARAETDLSRVHAERVQAIVSAGQSRLVELGELHAQTKDPAESVRLQQAIDLLKRTMEVRILEMQETELQRLGKEEVLAELRPVLERCLAELEERQLEYGLPVPVILAEEE